MRQWWLGVLSVAAVTASNAAESPHVQHSPPHPADLALIKQLAGELKAELTKALQVSPEHAIEVCNIRAPEIAAKIAPESEGIEIGRTSLRVRNPANAPNDWQREVLESFQRRHDSGEAAGSLEYSVVVKTDGYIERRYMRAIETEPLCVTCHGRQLAPTIEQTIAKKYPNDAATGFDVGDLRGAIYVVRHFGDTIGETGESRRD